jgi:hypothetical protein
MLVEPDKTKLGDGYISAEEALKKSFEDTERRVEQYRLPDQDELAEESRRLGHPMTSNELIRRVTKLNPDLWAEDSIANPKTVTGFYTAHDKKKIFCVAFDKGWLPEFSIVVEDRAGLPVRERRGWRTVLVRLLEGGYLTFEQILAGFGDALGTNNRRWRSLVRNYR